MLKIQKACKVFSDFIPLTSEEYTVQNYFVNTIYQMLKMNIFFMSLTPIFSTCSTLMRNSINILMHPLPIRLIPPHPLNSRLLQRLGQILQTGVCTGGRLRMTSHNDATGARRLALPKVFANHDFGAVDHSEEVDAVRDL